MRFLRYFLWIVDLDGTLNDDRWRLDKYRGDPRDSKSWTEYHNHWNDDQMVPQTQALVESIPVMDRLVFVSLRHQTHNGDTFDHLQHFFGERSFDLYLYDDDYTKEEDFWRRVVNLRGEIKERKRRNEDVLHGGTLLVDDSDWRVPIARDILGDVVHLKVGLSGRE